MKLPHIDKGDAIVAGGYIVFILAFWLLGPTAKIGKATAFFGLAALTGFYAILVRTIKKHLLPK